MEVCLVKKERLHESAGGRQQPCDRQKAEVSF